MVRPVVACNFRIPTQKASSGSRPAAVDTIITKSFVGDVIRGLNKIFSFPGRGMIEPWERDQCEYAIISFESWGVFFGVRRRRRFCFPLFVKFYINTSRLPAFFNYRISCHKEFQKGVHVCLQLLRQMGTDGGDHVYYARCKIAFLKRVRTNTN